MGIPRNVALVPRQRSYERSSPYKDVMCLSILLTQLSVQVKRKRTCSISVNAAALAPELEASPASQDLPSNLAQVPN